MVDRPTQARLVLDSRAGEQRLGIRASGTEERLLVFRAPSAHVEVRLAPPTLPDGQRWMYGQWIGIPPAAGSRPTASVVLRLAEPAADAREIDVARTGDFALGLPASGPVRLEFLPSHGPAVHVRFEV